MTFPGIVPEPYVSDYIFLFEKSEPDHNRQDYLYLLTG